MKDSTIRVAINNHPKESLVSNIGMNCLSARKMLAIVTAERNAMAQKVADLKQLIADTEEMAREDRGELVKANGQIESLTDSLSVMVQVAETLHISDCEDSCAELHEIAKAKALLPKPREHSDG